jgi:hypothetical protein
VEAFSNICVRKGIGFFYDIGRGNPRIAIQGASC